MRIRNLGRFENGQPYEAWRRRVLSSEQSIINIRKLKNKNDTQSKNDNGAQTQETAA